MNGLVLDGGGVFGIGQARILAKVDLSKFDFFVGTSIGSVIAAKAAIGDSLDDIPEFFHVWMPKIFKRNFLRKANIFVPRYPDDNLDLALDILFGDRDLGDVKKPLFVTAANLFTKKLKVFDSVNQYDGEWKLRDVCRSATAAETYFAPWKGYADGGIFANNPSMVAVVSAVGKLGAKIEDIRLFSIGCGECNIPDDIRTNGYAHMSLIKWARWLMDAFLHGAANSMHDHFVRVLPIKAYERVEFSINPNWKMDRPYDMIKAEMAWQDDIRKAIDRIEAF